MKQLEADLQEKKVNYNNNPVLKWCLTNTEVKRDENDNIRPVKRKESNSKDRWSSKLDYSLLRFI
jgi:phage terminase large subunit-like protein